MDRLTWVGVIAWTVVTFWQFENDSMRVAESRWYDSRWINIPGRPPKWIFGFAWPILFGLMSASVVLFWNNATAVSQYDTVLILYLVNLLLNKMWSVAFFGQRRVGIALGILLATLGTACVVLVYYGIYASDTDWTSFGLYFAYPLWLSYAVYLNAFFFYVDMISKKQRKDYDNLSPEEERIAEKIKLQFGAKMEPHLRVL
jgi:tryptophan-rich sensory protein